MKIGFYSPYLDSLAGGERYILTLASHWSSSHDIDVFWDHPSILQEAQKRFNVDLSRVHTASNIFRSHKIIQKTIATRSYDLMFFLSDGSVPTSFARYNILHFQVPFARVIMPFWKASRYQCIVCNSKFTKKYLDKNIKIPISVIYPPVDVDSITAGKKKKLILSVGRFSSLYGAKKYDVLLEVFRKSHKEKELAKWRYIIAGGLLKSDIPYFNQLKLKAKGLPVEFYPNCPPNKLLEFYRDASLYWHAAGFGETIPENMEHFGISTVESMAAGCIPCVFAAGGQKEIITDGRNGYLWKTTDELAKKTIDLISTEYSLDTMRLAAEKRAGDFSEERFKRSFDTLLSQLCKNDS
jgi:glycosyltransferase involved in cell wall biosynthesis